VTLPGGIVRLPKGQSEPALATVSKLLRDEVLAIWYSVNRFTFTPFVSGTEPDPLGFLARWRASLGKHLKHLRNMEFEQNYHPTYKGVREDWVFSCTYTISLATKLAITIVDTRERKDGRCSYCVCELESSLSAAVQKAGGHDGRALLSVVESVLVLNLGNVEFLLCDSCQKWRLVMVKSANSK